MSIVDQVKKICQAYQLQPTRSKGQNFVINKAVIDKVVGSANINADESVLEIGPGLGFLTEALIVVAKQVISVELDQKLFKFLQDKFAGSNNLKLINQDILFFQPETAGLSRYKIVANLPYNITSYFLKRFLTQVVRPQTMTLLLQREVAQRICAKPGELSLLGISVQLYGQPRIVAPVSRQNFWPVPQVESAIIQIDQIKTDKQVAEWLDGVLEKHFWQLCHIGFSAKRKQLQNNLAAGLKISNEVAKQALLEVNLLANIRAQDLSLTDWLQLAKKLKIYLN